LGKVGKSKSTKEIPIPSTGEPEDIISEVDLLKSKENVPAYYEICISSESDFPIGGVPIDICSVCGREEINGESRILKMNEKMWKGQNIFFLKTTNYIIITDNLKIALDKYNPSNCKFTDITFKK
jgi:hypothetical protein